MSRPGPVPTSRTSSCSCTAGSRTPGSSTRSACTASTSATTAGRSSPRTATRESPPISAGAPHRSQLEGDWQLVDHGRAISPEIVGSQRIRLHRNGTITGARTGRWRLEAGHRATVLLDGQTFRGVFARGWRESAGAWTTTFTVLGPDGRSLWGTQEV
ncbi:lipocalin-like domain-containing protein [Brachybacterium sp. Z12]|uniref:lipocalin-like domain-containing protein n=1 Tax=Brachybacterium sp. Z12 TaxID=2759167 RepID=UPI00223B514B|nr:glycoside hydrolase family 43 C-terminal domain-containing protein [Brachybacterium sp. Z12]